MTESADALWSEQTAWSIATEPDLVIGDNESSSDGVAFSNISGVFADSQHVFVAEASLFAVRKFDRSGKLVATFGGKGAGPGEFTDLCCLLELDDSTFTAYDSRQSRFSMFHKVRGFIASGQIPKGDPLSIIVPIGRYSDGELVTKTERLPRPGIGKPGESFRDTIVFSVHSVKRSGQQLTIGDGTEIGRTLGAEMYVPKSGRGYIPRSMPFGRRPAWSFRDSLLYLGAGDSWSYQVHTRRALVHNVARRTELPPVTPHDYAAAKEKIIAASLKGEYRQSAAPGVINKFWTDLFAEMPVPSVVPPYSRFLADDEGNLWIEEWKLEGDSEGRWHVFNPLGQYLGPIVMPAGYQPAIVSQRITGIQRDESGVETVVVRRVSKPDGAK